MANFLVRSVPIPLNPEQVVRLQNWLKEASESKWEWELVSTTAVPGTVICIFRTEKEGAVANFSESY